MKKNFDDLDLTKSQESWLEIIVSHLDESSKLTLFDDLVSLTSEERTEFLLSMLVALGYQINIK